MASYADSRGAEDRDAKVGRDNRSGRCKGGARRRAGRCPPRRRQQQSSRCRQGAVFAPMDARLRCAEAAAFECARRDNQQSDRSNQAKSKQKANQDAHPFPP